MRTDASVPPVLHLVRGVLAPAIWLERAHGRWRLALALLYILLIFVGGFFFWWATSLNGLPDVGEPFDVTEFDRVNVPDEENAFVLFRQARDRFQPLAEEFRKLQRGGQKWSQAAPEIRAWVESNREAIDLWRQGTERPKALAIPPRELNYDSKLTTVQFLVYIIRVADLEGARFEDEGDFVGAWRTYRAMLRSSRHVGMTGCGIQRLVGSAALQQASARIIAWAANPRVSGDLVREALDEVNACESMTPPVSDAIKIEYLSMLKALDTPRRWVNDSLKDDKAWYHHLPLSAPARIFWWREPERSRRIARSMFANWLAYCDKPPSQRPKVATALELYEPDLTAPASVRFMPPVVLEGWEKTSLILEIYLRGVGIFVRKGTDRERATFGATRVRLAEELYLREQGVPPTNLKALVGPYLKSLPEGYEADDESSLEPASLSSNPK